MAQITRNLCDQITILNNGSADITYSVDELQDDKTFLEIVSSVTLTPNESAVYDFPNDGVFQVNTTGIAADGVLTASDFTDGDQIVIDTKTYTLQDTLVNADGNVLITGLAAATQNLGYTGQPSDTDTITVDGKVYTFQTTLTNVDGNVLIGATSEITAANLIAAVTLAAGAGTKYALATVVHPTATCILSVGPNILFTYKTLGKIGNGTVVSEAAANYTWTAGTMTGGTTDVASTIVNLEAALDLGSGAGTLYATAMTEHPTVKNSNYTATTWTVEAKVAGVAGNTIALTETGASMAWDNATMTGGDGIVVSSTVHIIYCAVRTCILNLISAIMSGATGCTCTDCFDVHSQKHYLYNTIMMTWYTFLASINTQYVDNNVYTALDPHDLEDMYFISQMIDKMTAYCACANELDSSDCNCS